MLNLIRKDLIITKSYIIKALAILIFCMFVYNKIDKQGVYVIGAYLIVQILISISFFYGEEAKENYILKSLPVKKKDVVLAKYTSIIIYSIASLILMYVINFIIHMLDVRYTIQFPEVNTILFSLSVIFASMSIEIPIHLKINYSKGRILNSIIYFCIFYMLFMLYDNSHLNNYIKTHNGSINVYNHIVLIFAIVSIILFIISIILSIKIYEKKESM
ncbi:ABC-2 transporter permease [Clostridium sporogenes]|uniref:ABC-2 transporter permease n=1 Tax=Clostridium sporogenes TaxID=1509 RepID=A0AAE4JT88_CLOSG|nr:ABC-2 transporter permease [Clostridium sporogenes]MDS1003996.1 ABC-2 transporter permease [Clostridium sporogenes]